MQRELNAADGGGGDGSGGGGGALASLSGGGMTCQLAWGGDGGDGSGGVAPSSSSRPSSPSPPSSSSAASPPRSARSPPNPMPESVSFELDIFAAQRDVARLGEQLALARWDAACAAEVVRVWAGRAALGGAPPPSPPPLAPSSSSAAVVGVVGISMQADAADAAGVGGRALAAREAVEALERFLASARARDAAWAAYATRAPNPYGLSDDTFRLVKLLVATRLAHIVRGTLAPDTRVHFEVGRGDMCGASGGCPFLTTASPPRTQIHFDVGAVATRSLGVDRSDCHWRRRRGRDDDDVSAAPISLADACLVRSFGWAMWAPPAPARRCGTRARQPPHRVLAPRRVGDAHGAAAAAHATAASARARSWPANHRWAPTGRSEPSSSSWASQALRCRDDATHWRCGRVEAKSKAPLECGRWHCPIAGGTRGGRRPQDRAEARVR